MEDYKDDPLRVERLQTPQGQPEDANELIQKYTNEQEILSREEMLEVFFSALATDTIDLVREYEEISFTLTIKVLRASADEEETVEELANEIQQFSQKEQREKITDYVSNISKDNIVEEYKTFILLWSAAIRNEEGISFQEIHDHILFLADSLEEFRQERGFQ